MGEIHTHFFIVFLAVSRSASFLPRPHPDFEVNSLGKWDFPLCRNFAVQSIDRGWLTTLG